MAKDKYDFIQELMENQKLTTAQRERILFLVSNELKNDNIHGVELSARLERIESDLGLLKSKAHPSINIDNSEINESELVEHEEEFLLFSDYLENDGELIEQFEQINLSKKNEIVVNPKHVADFMSLFNKRDGLKYLTHDFDENDNSEIASFLAKAKNIFTQITKQLSIPKSLWTIVEQFAFNKDPKWTALSESYDKKIVRTGWHKWTFDKIGNNLHPIRNERNKIIINDFRRLTRVESPNFDKLIDKCIQLTFKEDANDFEIEKIDLAKADFYTHVGNLKIAIETIFEEIKKWTDSNDKKKITIKYERELSDEYFLRKIIITHHNSFPTKELQVLLKEWHQKGNMGKINERLNGYCYWSIETKIEEKSTRVNILKESTTSDFEEIETASGFSHILTFYYK